MHMDKYIFIFISLLIVGCAGSGGGGDSTVQKVLSIEPTLASKVASYESYSIPLGFGAVDNLIIEFSNDNTLAYESIGGMHGLCENGANPKITIYYPEWNSQSNSNIQDALFLHLMGHCHAGKIHNTDLMGGTGPGAVSFMHPNWNFTMYSPFDSNRFGILFQAFWSNPN